MGVNQGLDFIILTSHADTFIVSTAFNLDVDSFVVKPVTPKTLRARNTLVMASANLLKKTTDYSDTVIDTYETGEPEPPKSLAFEAPPWKPQEVDTAGIVKRELSAVIPGSKIATDLWAAAGHLLFLLGRALDERTLDRLWNLYELDRSATHLVVREVAR